MGRLGALVVGVVALLAVAVEPAGAALPTGNLLPNPGFEAGSGSATGNELFTIPFWTRFANSSVRSVIVRYGAPGFPTIAQSAGLGGGANFFAGGPPVSDPNKDDDGGLYKYALVGQDVTVPPQDEAAVAAGKAQVTVSGCLGGYATQDDRVDIVSYAYTAGGMLLSGSTVSLGGPSAAERGGVTKLLPRGATGRVDASTRSFRFYLQADRRSGTDTYNDGYADNLSVRLSAAGARPPAPDCPPTGRAKTPGQGQGTAPTGQGGTNTAVGITRVGRRLTFKRGYALVKLHCALRDSPCTGTLSLTASLPKARKSAAAKLGSARFKIAAGKTKTVKVRLKRSARRRIKALSKRRVRRLKITATARVGTQRTKFALGAVRKR